MEITMKQKRLTSFFVLGLVAVLPVLFTGCPKLSDNPAPPPP